MKFSKIIIGVFGLLLFACTPSSVSSPYSFIPKNVYIGGEWNSQATYWNDGQRKSIPNPSWANCLSMFVSGTDVYLAGWGDNPANVWVNIYWKNGNPVFSDALYYGGYNIGIAVVGNDVYTIKGDAGAAMYYKNSVGYYLPINGDYPSVVAITTSGTDIYIAGNDFGAVYWKNGVRMSLEGTTGPGIESKAIAIAVSGSDVYVVGTINSVATYWKNGMVQTMENVVNASNSNPNAIISSIAVSDRGDTFIAGQIYTLINGIYYPSAAYWKNGTLVPLEQAKENVLSSATAIAVSGTDVHVVGQSGFPSEGTYWKNGIAYKLGGVPNSIIVK